MVDPIVILIVNLVFCRLVGLTETWTLSLAVLKPLIKTLRIGLSDFEKGLMILA